MFWLFVEELQATGDSQALLKGPSPVLLQGKLQESSVSGQSEAQGVQSRVTR